MNQCKDNFFLSILILVVIILVSFPKSIICFQPFYITTSSSSTTTRNNASFFNNQNNKKKISTTHLNAKAKSKSKNKKKSNNGGSSTTSIKIGGFGGVGSAIKQKSSAKIELDKSTKTLSFYNFIEEYGAGDNIKRVGLAYIPLPTSNKEEEKTPIKMRGAIALKPIKKDDVIFSIPYELALSLGREGNDPTIPAVNLLQNYLCKRMVVGISTTIIDNYKPYLDLLPQYVDDIKGSDYEGCTDFFSDEALNELQCPYIMDEVLKRRQKINERYELDIKPKELVFKDGKPVTIDHLKYATWLITSRVLNVQGYRLLIPFIDMCNHNRNSANVPTGTVGGDLKIIAGTDINPGDEITICYEGNVGGNDRFIQDYGFLDCDDKAFDLMLKNIEKNNYYDSTVKALASSTIEEDEKLLLDDNNLASDVRCAVTFRIGVKKALERVK